MFVAPDTVDSNEYHDRNIQLSRIIYLILKFVARIRTVLYQVATVVDVVRTITTQTHFLFNDDFVEKDLFSSVMDLMSQTSEKISHLQDGCLVTSVLFVVIGMHAVYRHDVLRKYSVGRAPFLF
jgi:hypothetical protein